jgi:hypothetical protein
MARIRDRLTKTTTGNYSRLFGNQKLGELIAKIQGTVIANGSELEKIINSLIKQDGRVLNDFDEIINMDIIHDNIYLIPKKVLKKSELIDFTGQEPDFVVLKSEKPKRHCYIIELKDGDNFDTKKAASEKLSLQKFESYISTKIQYTTSIHVCCFNQSEKTKIVTGFKNKINLDEAMTGEEFCKLLKIDYLNIIDSRNNDQIDNLEYFIEEVLKIDILRQKIFTKLVKNNK